MSNNTDESTIEKKSSMSGEERPPRPMSVAGPDDSLDIDANVQYAGILKKPPFGTKNYGKLTRWTERFCVVKESFLLYYDKSEKKAYESKKMFNIHPKGVIPLAGCAIERFDDAGKPGFKITHSSFKTGNLVMAARNPEERDNWIAILKECSKITWNNAQLGAAQIKQLEENTARISQEKIEYIKKLQEEAEARKNEAGKKEELERLAKQLEEEKSKMENIANQFKEEKEMTNQELLDAMEAMRKVEEERRDADKKQQEMHENLLRVEEEKKRQEDLLKQQQEEAEKLAATSDALKSHLETAEENAKRLEDEKLLTERQLEENAKKAEVAEEEKKKLQRTATQAQLNLEEVAASREQTQKELELTSTTLEMEKRERQKLEKRLRLAEDSLKRLDGALRDSGLKVSLEIEADVTTLKSFFEDAAAEAEIQAKKHLLMEEAVRAKKNYERAVYRKNEDMFQARKGNPTNQTRKRCKSTPTFYDDYRNELARQNLTDLQIRDASPEPTSETPLTPSAIDERRKQLLGNEKMNQVLSLGDYVSLLRFSTLRQHDEPVLRWERDEAQQSYRPRWTRQDSLGNIAPLFAPSTERFIEEFKGKLYGYQPNDYHYERLFEVGRYDDDWMRRNRARIGRDKDEDDEYMARVNYWIDKERKRAQGEEKEEEVKEEVKEEDPAKEEEVKEDNEVGEKSLEGLNSPTVADLKGLYEGEKQTKEEKKKKKKKKRKHKKKEPKEESKEERPGPSTTPPASPSFLRWLRDEPYHSDKDFPGFPFYEHPLYRRDGKSPRPRFISARSFEEDEALRARVAAMKEQAAIDKHGSDSDQLLDKDLVIDDHKAVKRARKGSVGNIASAFETHELAKKLEKELDEQPAVVERYRAPLYYDRRGYPLYNRHYNPHYRYYSEDEIKRKVGLDLSDEGEVEDAEPIEDLELLKKRRSSSVADLATSFETVAHRNELERNLASSPEARRELRRYEGDWGYPYYYTRGRKVQDLASHYQDHPYRPYRHYWRFRRNSVDQMKQRFEGERRSSSEDDELKRVYNRRRQLSSPSAADRSAVSPVPLNSPVEADRKALSLEVPDEGGAGPSTLSPVLREKYWNKSNNLRRRQRSPSEGAPAEEKKNEKGKLRLVVDLAENVDNVARIWEEKANTPDPPFAVLDLTPPPPIKLYGSSEEEPSSASSERKLPVPERARRYVDRRTSEEIESEALARRAPLSSTYVRAPSLEPIQLCGSDEEAEYLEQRAVARAIRRERKKKGALFKSRDGVTIIATPDSPLYQAAGSSSSDSEVVRRLSVTDRAILYQIKRDEEEEELEELQRSRPLSIARSPSPEKQPEVYVIPEDAQDTSARDTFTESNVTTEDQGFGSQSLNPGPVSLGRDEAEALEEFVELERELDESSRIQHSSSSSSGSSSSGSDSSGSSGSSDSSSSDN